MALSHLSTPIGLLLTESVLSSKIFYLIAGSYILSTGLFFLASYSWMPKILGFREGGCWRDDTERKATLICFAIVGAVGAMVISIPELPFFALLLAALLTILMSVKTGQPKIHWSCHILGMVAMLALLTHAFLDFRGEHLQVIARSFMWTFAYGSLSRFYFFLRGKNLHHYDDLLLFGWLGLGLGNDLPKAMLAICASFLIYSAYKELNQKSSFPAASLREFPYFLLFGLSLAHLFA